MKRRLLSILLPLCAALPATPALADVPQLINYQGRVAVGGVNFDGTGQFKFSLVDAGTDTSRQATGTAALTGQFVTSVSVDDGGSGYATPPAVGFAGGGGSGAAAHAVVSAGVVTAVVVDNAGSGYTSPPAVIIDPPPASVAHVTYWSNDGTGGGGGEPAAAVSLDVDKGLYSVLLGDAGIPNMTVIPHAVFANEEVYLRVWFDDGVNGSQLLTPNQRIAAVGYAMMADSARIAQGVVQGSITSDMIASGAVDSSEIADGSIADADISPGAAIAPAKIADGAGSGLDADLLDGQDSASFAIVDHAHGDGSGYTKVEVDAMIAALETRIGNVEIGIPPTPANLAATAISWNEVQLDWSHESYFETGFQVERSMDGTNFFQLVSLPANAVTYTDFDLSPVTTYYYRVRAFNPDNQTPYSNTASATTEDTTEITGRLDTAFGTNGVAIHHNAAGGNKGDYGKGMALDASGRILVTGYSYSSATDIDMALWRYNPDGSIDTTFGTGGVVTHGNAAGGNSYDYGIAVAVDASGRILVAGNSIGVDATDDMVIWCYTSDGIPDTSFGTNGVVVDQRPGQDFGNAIAIDASNRILVAGCTRSVGYEMTVWRYNPDGTPDTTFGSDGVKIHAKSGTSEFGHSMVIDGDGRIVVAGRGANSGNGYDMTIWRHNSDGSPDATFGTDGIVSHNNAAGGNNADYGNDVVIDATGRIVVVGHSANNFGNKDMVVWRYDPDGTLDATFDTDGYVTREVVIGGTDEAHGVVIDASGRIVVSGLAHNSAGNYDMTIWRLNPSGSADHSFDQDGFLQHDAAAGGGGNNSEAGYAIRLDSSGRILVAGYSYNTSGNADMAIWRYK